MRHFCGALALLFFSVTITFGQAQPLENVHIKQDTLRSLNAWMQREETLLAPPYVFDGYGQPRGTDRLLCLRPPA